MKTNSMRNWLLRIVCMVLIAALALLTGCAQPEPGPEVPQTTQFPENATHMGEGQTEFYFYVVDAEGNRSNFVIHTDETIVGDALQKLELIDGEEAEYGLYVKSVTGIPLDYETHGKFWCFMIGGESSLTGVDSVAVEAGMVCSFEAKE